jgi:hypothetical protein
MSMQRVTPDTYADVREREKLGGLYYLRHPARGGADTIQVAAEAVGDLRNYRAKLGEKAGLRPRTAEELARENALKAAKLGISPSQLQDLNYARLKATAEYGALGNALAKGRGGTGPRYSSGRTGGSPFNYMGGFGLGSMGPGPGSMDQWGNIGTGTVGRGLRSSYMGTGMIDMFGRTRDVSRPDFGIPPSDIYGNPTHDRAGRLLPQAPRQMWLPQGAGVSQAGWLPQMQQSGDYLGGFKLGGGAAAPGGAGGMGIYRPSPMEGFNLGGVGLGGGLGGFALGGGLGMGRGIGMGDGLDGFGMGDMGDRFSGMGDYGPGQGFKLGVRGLMDNGDGYLTLGDAYRVGKNGRF